MTKVVLEMIALIFERVECFIFDFPSEPPPSRPGVGVAFRNDEIADPSKMTRLFARLELPICQMVEDTHILIGFVQGRIIEKTKTMNNALLFDFKLSCTISA